MIAALIIGSVTCGIAAIAWKLHREEQSADLRTIAEWEQEFDVRVTGYEGFMGPSGVWWGPMDEQEFVERASRSTCQKIHRQVQDVGAPRRSNEIFRGRPKSERMCAVRDGDGDGSWSE